MTKRQEIIIKNAIQEVVYGEKRQDLIKDLIAELEKKDKLNDFESKKLHNLKKDKNSWVDLCSPSHK